MDRFRVEVIAKTPNPQQVVYAALHQDYSEDLVIDERDSWPSESKSGELIVKRLLAGDRGHFGPLEHPQIIFNCGYFPHSVMQQVRTHRVGISFDVQCLAAHTEITFVKSCGSLQNIKISQLYQQWVKGEKVIDEEHCDRKQPLQQMRLRVLNEDTNLFEFGQIKEVLCQGIQPVYRLTLDDQKMLDCTVNHRLYTVDGWQTMGDALGLVTAADNSVVEMTKPCFVMCNGIAIQAAKVDQQVKAHPVQVKSIEYLGWQMTYDLEVEAPWHNFVANGLVVHNSNRYTGSRIIQAAQGLREIEEVFYLRPVGHYLDRQGKRYDYTPEMREKDLAWCLEAAKRYQQLIAEGVSEEHARGIIPFDVRQHFVVSLNARSLMHLLDLRAKPDAQLECQKLCDHIFPHFQEWMPELAAWYEKYRLKKARLSP